VHSGSPGNLSPSSEEQRSYKNSLLLRRAISVPAEDFLFMEGFQTAFAIRG